MQPGQNHVWNPGDSQLRVSDTLYNTISALMASANAAAYDVISETDDGDASDSNDSEQGARNECSRTELDSHANIPVVGRHAYIIAEVGKNVEVSLLIELTC